jgi:NADH dehydrogenase
MDKPVIKIAIIGGGFGGLQTALGLEKKFRNNKNIAIALIDKRDYHLFTPNLYEAATAGEELVTINQVKKSITLPFKEILRGKNIKFIQGEVTQLDPNKKNIILGSKKLDYDYVVLALGSQSEFFNIPGARENSMILKDLPDALRMRNKIAFAMEAQRFEVNKKNLHFVIAGGGYTGVELVGELKGLVDFLAWQNQYPREKVTIEIIEGNNKLIAGFDDRMSRDALYRLKEIGVEVRLSEKIVAVDAHYISLASGDKLSYDILFWSAGIKPCSVTATAELSVDARGKLQLNEFLQLQNFHNIFGLGDMAFVMGTNGKPVPASAQDAADQGKYLAYAIPYLIKNQKPPKPYKNIKHGFIVNAGGKWAVMSYRGIYSTGFFAWFVDKLAHIRYYMSVVSIWKSVKYIISQTEIYSRND